MTARSMTFCSSRTLPGHGYRASASRPAAGMVSIRRPVRRAKCWVKWRTNDGMSSGRSRKGGSAIDGRTTRHDGYAKSQHARPRIEPAFGWLKTIAWMRKVKLRGLAKVDWLMVFASAAFNVLRLPKLLLNAA